MNYQEFISKVKSLLVAPAGYGKTHTLAECLKYTPDYEKQLILTHTHAGIASIKEKIRAMGIPSSKYHIETISGFAQKYVESFYCGSDKKILGEKTYFKYIIEKSLFLFKLESVKRIIKRSYKGLFVDEYQDCSMSQHNMIMLLAEVLPTRILGDHMQGIFNFDKNDPLVNFGDDLVDFEYKTTLTTPWRWKKEGHNEQLGNSLKEIRNVLESDNKKIDFSSYPGIIYENVSDGGLTNPRSSIYARKLRGIINAKEEKDNNQSLLILFPDNYKLSNINVRSSFRSRVDYSKQLILLEAFDEDKYYTISENIDAIVSTVNSKSNVIEVLKKELFLKLFNSTDIKAWFGKNYIKNKREPHKENCKNLNKLVDDFVQTFSLDTLLVIILFLKDGLNLKSQRHELLNGILKAINFAIIEKITVYDAMTQQKNILRRVGRKVQGKCIGTTLLTKGLEFDTVVILDAHEFKDKKHFYVAITRACKKLIVFSEKEILNFN